MKRGLPNLQVTCKLFESYQNQSVVLRLQSLAARLPRPRRLYLETADGVQLPGPGRGGYFLGCSKYPKCKGTREAPPEILEQVQTAAAT